MKISFKYLYLFSALMMPMFLASCITTACHDHADNGRANSSHSDQDMALLWFKYAAEARALYYQAYNIARDRLDSEIARSRPQDHLAIIMDIDETILDNTPFQASLIQKGTSYSPKSWTEWSEKGRDQALPGAQTFLRYAASCGVDIFYISNRHTDEFNSTARNLKALDFPMIDEDHLLLQNMDEGKEPKRQELFKKYKVVLLMGDNLDDFSNIFDQYDIAKRFSITDSNREEFGRRFIMLPNPIYGDWEKTLYSGRNLEEPQKSEIKTDLIQKAGNY